jgi:integrase
MCWNIFVVLVHLYLTPVSSHMNEISMFSFCLHCLNSWKLFILFYIYRNKDTDSSKPDVIEEVDDETSTKKKKGKKEKKKKKDYEDDDIEDLAQDLDDVAIEEGKKDNKQSKVSGMCVCVCVCVCVWRGVA